MAIFLRNWKNTPKGEQQQTKQTEISHTEQHQAKEIKSIPPEVSQHLKTSEQKELKKENKEEIKNEQPKQTKEQKEITIPKYELQPFPESEIVHVRDIVKRIDPSEIYEDYQQIGEGGMGCIFRVKRKSDKFKVVLKRMKYYRFDRANLLNEIRMMKKYQHKNIIHFIDCYLNWGVIWIAMEYMNAGTLNDLVLYHDQCPMTEYMISYVIHEVANALTYLHSFHCIHRDIKSDNIFLKKDGSVKIGDFGLAVQLLSSHSTRSDKVGTSFWMSPEVIKEEEYNEKVDIWGLGVLCYEMVEGYPLYFEKNAVMATLTISSKGAPPLDEKKYISPAFKELIQSCVEYEPSKRPSAQQILEHEFIQWGDNEEKKLCLISCIQQVRKLMYD